MRITHSLGNVADRLNDAEWFRIDVSEAFAASRIIPPASIGFSGCGATDAT